MADEQCIFCMIAQNKIQTLKVHEDDLCVAFLDIKPASKGHMQVISKAHSPLFSELDDASRQRVFSMAFLLGKTIVMNLGASGVSYIVNEGAGAGQRVAHASIHVIPRYENDGIAISWPDKQMSQEELGKYYNEIAQMFNSSAPKENNAQKPAQIVQKPAEPEKKAEEKKEPIKEIKPRIPRYW